MLKPRILLILVTTMALLVSGCDITFKRKSSSAQASSTSDKQRKSATSGHSAPVSKEAGRFFSSNEKKLITDFFYSASNEQILRDNYELTRTSEDLRSQIRTGSRLPANIQLLPLPLALEGKLSPAKGSLIRIQVEYSIILLDIRSRIIMDMFNLNPDNKR